MMSFRGGRLGDYSAPASTIWLISAIAEAKGRQDLYAKQAPQILKALRETALVQSVESSNRIEGVTVEPRRLRPLVLGTARPRDRSEQDIHGYRQALNLMHTKAAQLVISPELLQRLHRTALEAAGDAGQWKTSNNDIIELRAGAPPRIRFRPLAWQQTPSGVNELCLAYHHALDQEHVPPLVAVAALVFDFLCIHPFRDGNGRVSRLLTLLVLYHHGFEVGRYISLEKLVEEAREEYYEALRRSSEGWHVGKHDLAPWVNYFLAIVHRAYRRFEERAGQMRSTRGAKRALVEAAIYSHDGSFTLVDLERTCPGVSPDMVRRVLRDLQKAGKVTCLGRGPGASWRKEGNTPK